MIDLIIDTDIGGDIDDALALSMALHAPNINLLGVREPELYGGSTYKQLLNLVADHCARRGDYYAIRPMLPELSDPGAAEPNALVKEFSSEDNVLEYQGTVALLQANRLMVEDVQAGRGTELLR